MGGVNTQKKLIFWTPKNVGTFWGIIFGQIDQIWSPLPKFADQIDQNDQIDQIGQIDQTRKSDQTASDFIKRHQHNQNDQSHRTQSTFSTSKSG